MVKVFEAAGMFIQHATNQARLPRESTTGSNLSVSFPWAQKRIHGRFQDFSACFAAMLEKSLKKHAEILESCSRRFKGKMSMNDT